MQGDFRFAVTLALLLTGIFPLSKTVKNREREQRN
jgi:hypothetical protein